MMCDDLDCNCCERAYGEGVGDGFVLGFVTGYSAGYKDGYFAALPEYEREILREEQRQALTARHQAVIANIFSPHRIRDTTCKCFGACLCSSR